MRAILLLFALLAANAAFADVGAGRFVERLELPSGQAIVVEEGVFEARSIGSFSIRLYEPAAPGDDTTFFLDGLVAARQGVIESVRLADVNCDGRSDIVVVIRSVGTGGYLSAYVFQYDDYDLRHFKTVEGLAAETDPVESLIRSACDAEVN